MKALRDFGEIITGKTPSTRNPKFYGDDVPFLKIPDMHGRVYALETDTMLSNTGASSQDSKSLPAGSISVSCIATPGLVILNHRQTHTNQQINSIVPYDSKNSKYLYWSCRKLASEIILGGSGGSVFHNMNKSTFSALEIIDGGIEINSSFEDLVSPFHDLLLLNEKENQHLAAHRMHCCRSWFRGSCGWKKRKWILENYLVEVPRLARVKEESEHYGCEYKGSWDRETRRLYSEWNR